MPEVIAEPCGGPERCVGLGGGLAIGKEERPERPLLGGSILALASVNVARELLLIVSPKP